MTYPEEYFAHMRFLADGQVFTRKDDGKKIPKK